jgi:putative membrane protein
MASPDKLGQSQACKRRADCVQMNQDERGNAMLGNIVVALVALVHLYIVYLEMAAWDTPRGHKAFNLTPEFAKASKVLAANQGLYNGFLAAGLIWGLYLGAAGFQVMVFFLLCVAIAGLYGAATASRKILFIQTVPALLGLALLWAGW